jgi:hypothetical protein
VQVKGLASRSGRPSSGRCLSTGRLVWRLRPRPKAAAHPLKLLKGDAP